MTRTALFIVLLTFVGIEADAHSFTEEQQQLVDFAYERFVLAGLELPTVTIVFPTDQDQCHGYGGVYVPSERTVRICRPSQTTMVHELAHAWAETTLTDGDRQAFLHLRGLDSWTDADRWDQRGAEHAAEIISWALMDRNISIRWIETTPDGTTDDTTRLFKLPHSSPDELAVAFQHLTGGQPTNRLADDLDHRSTNDTISPEARR